MRHQFWYTRKAMMLNQGTSLLMPTMRQAILTLMSLVACHGLDAFIDDSFLSECILV